MSKPNDGGPAFPMPISNGGYSIIQGMSLRDYFAASVQVPDDMGWCADALMGEPAPDWTSRGDYDNNIKCAAWWATARARYRLMEADAMLAEREKGGGQ